MGLQFQFAHAVDGKNVLCKIYYETVEGGVKWSGTARRGKEVVQVAGSVGTADGVHAHALVEADVQAVVNSITFDPV